MSSSDFPWQHSFPPFYTLQPHAETRAKQLEAWRRIVLDYCQRRSIAAVDVSQFRAEAAVFRNDEIGRKISDETFAAVLDDLVAHGNLEWSDPKSKTRAHVYWRRPDQWAGLIYEWAKENSLANGGVCTFYEIIESDESSPVYKLDKEILVKALKVLQTEKKAELFGGGEDEGVKFF